MIQNIWNKITIYCGCHEQDHSIKMLPHAPSDATMVNGETSMFYSCPKYYPENRAQTERACFNRLSIADYEKMVNHICEKLESGDQFSLVNLTGYTWKSKNGILFHVLKHDIDHIDVLVVNKRALHN